MKKILGILILVVISGGVGYWFGNGGQIGEVISFVTPEKYQNDFELPSGRHSIQAGKEPVGGPAIHRILLASSKDGINFEKLNVLLTDQADVPNIVVDSRGVIYVYYIGASLGDVVHGTAVAISYDDGETWVFKNVTHSKVPDGSSDPVDPSVVILEDGTFGMYETMQELGDDYPTTYYFESQNGIDFELIGEAFDPGYEVLDPSVIKIGDTWHLFAGGNQRGYNWHAISADGISFEFYAEEQYLFDSYALMLSNGLQVEEGYRYFGFEQENIVSIFSTDGYDWETEDGYRLEFDSENELEYVNIKDSSVARLEDGTYLMVYVTEIPK